MPTFSFVARDKSGQQVEQTQEAPSKDALIKSLRDQGLYVSQISEQKAPKVAKKSQGFRFGFGKRVGLKDLAIFCRQFSTMINAGVSLVRCLDVLEQQSANVTLKEIIRDIQKEVEGGATLSRSMAKFPRVFSELAVGLVRAGEVGGVLDETLDRLAGFLEADLALRQKIKSSMTYPVLVLFVAIGIVTFLVTFILPKFMQMFLDLGMEESDFPAPTRFMMNVSHFMTSKWYIMLGIVVGLWIAIGRIKRTKTGKRYYDTVMLKLPGLWQFQIAALLSQIGCVTLPSETLEKMYKGIRIEDDEKIMFQSHPAAGARLLANISRFEVIAEMIGLQLQDYKDFAPPADSRDKLVQAGAQILRLALDYDELCFQGCEHEYACELLARREGEYNPNLLEVLRKLEGENVERIHKLIDVMGLKPGMIVDQDVIAESGLLLAVKGQEVTFPVIERLRNFAATVGVHEPFQVIIVNRRRK